MNEYQIFKEHILLQKRNRSKGITPSHLFPHLKDFFCSLKSYFFKISFNLFNPISIENFIALKVQDSLLAISSSVISSK